MTPKEKAKELVDNFYQLAENIEWTTDEEKKEKSEKYNDDLGNDVLIYWNELAKQSALMAVDLLIDCTPSINIYPPNLQSKNIRVKEYWQEVKKEIDNLK